MENDTAVSQQGGDGWKKIRLILFQGQSGTNLCFINQWVGAQARALMGLHLYSYEGNIEKLSADKLRGDKTKM